MLKFLADENFNNHILRGLAGSGIDLVRVQDVGLAGAEDPIVLAWAADQNRVLLTHDVRTIPTFVADRIKVGLPMCGVIRCSPSLAVSQASDDLQLIAACCDPAELENLILHLPLK